MPWVESCACNSTMRVRAKPPKSTLASPSLSDLNMSLSLQRRLSGSAIRSLSTPVNVKTSLHRGLRFLSMTLDLTSLPASENLTYGSEKPLLSIDLRSLAWLRKRCSVPCASMRACSGTGADGEMYVPGGVLSSAPVPGGVLSSAPRRAAATVDEPAPTTAPAPAPAPC